jgi:hypothetical protein
MAERVQVQGLGGQVPGISPTIQRGGQYAVQVQQAGRNKLMDLADALGQVNPLLQQYGQLQQVQEKIGVEQAEVVEEQNVIQELKKLGDKDINGFHPLARYNRDRAYRDVLLKRAINNSVIPQMQSDSDDLLNLDKYKTREEFDVSVDEYINQQWANFSNEVGNVAASSVAAKSLWNTVTAPYKNKLSITYEQKKQQAVEQGLQDELTLTLSNVTRDKGFDTAILADVADNFEQLFADSGVDKTQRNKLMIDGFAANVDQLYAQRRYNDAKRLLDSMGTIRVNKKPVFGTKEATRQLTPLLSKVNTKLAEVSNQSTAQQSDVLKGRIYSVLSSGVRDREDMPASKLITLRSIFTSMNPEMQQEQVDQYIDKVFAGTGDIGQNLLNVLDEAAATEGDLASSLYFKINDDVIRDYEQIKGIGITPIAITEETMPEVLEDFRAYVKDNDEEETPWKPFLSDKGGKIPKFQELIDESERLTAGNYVLKKEYYTNIASQLLANLGAVDDQLKDSEITLDDRSYFYNSGAVSFIKNKVKEEAFRLQAQDEDVRDAALEDLTTELIQKERQRYEGLAKASAITLGDKPAAKIPLEKRVGVTKAEELQKKYKTMFPEALLEQKRKEIPFFRREIESDRKRMSADDDIQPLAISLTRYGYNMFDPESYQMLQKANLDADDVQLFGSLGELNRRYLEFDDVLQKDLERQPLSEEEKKVKETYQGLGIYDVPSLEAFRRTQESNH